MLYAHAYIMLYQYEVKVQTNNSVLHYTILLYTYT